MSDNKHQVKNDHSKLTYPEGDGEISIQKPKGEFRRYIKWNGQWRHVYIVSTHHQQTLLGKPEKMVEFKLTKNSRTIHSAPRHAFYEEKPKVRRNIPRLS